MEINEHLPEITRNPPDQGPNPQDLRRSPSYRPSECCGAADCDYLDERPGEPCWGQVEMDSPGDDDDGWPIPGHLCRGHRGAYDWHLKEQPYHPEETT